MGQFEHGQSTVHGRHTVRSRSRRHGKQRLFSFVLFLGIYTFFVANTFLTTFLVNRYLVAPHPKFALTNTFKLYQLLQKNTASMSRGLTHAAHGLSADSLFTYLSICLHNTLLVLIGAALFSLAMFLPHFQQRILYHATEYLRTLTILFFFSFGPAILVINALLIPFLLASLAYAAGTSPAVLATMTLIHGSVEYMSLSLLIMITLRAWRLTWSKNQIGLPETYKTRHHHSNWITDAVAHVWRLWYTSVFSERSLGRRFQTAVAPQRKVAYTLFATSAAIFFCAAFLEVYVSPRIGLYLLGHS